MRSDFANGLSRAFGRVGFQLKKHSPEILLATGVIGGIASAVLACKATTKINGIIEETKDKVEMIHEGVEAGQVIGVEDGETKIVEYSQEDGTKDLAIVYTQTGIKLLKLYGPALALGAASLGCILASHNIIHKRNVALGAAFAAIDTSFKEYRGRVKERFGEQLDRELKYNIKAQEVEETVVDEKGNEKTVKKTINTADPNNYSDYARFFDEYCVGYWNKNAEDNLFFLKQQQNWANEKLKTRGYLFLNEVYEMLGIPVTKAGQVVGWVYDSDRGDGYVDFGIYNLYNEKARDFVNGRERSILLDFNVDGNIWELMH